MRLVPPWFVRALTRTTDILAKIRRRLMPPYIAAVELGTMSWVAQSLSAFCELGLADELALGPRTAEQLALQGYGERDRLFRLLRALTAYDVVKFVGRGRFALGHVGNALTGDGSAAPMVLYANSPWHMDAYGNLANGIRSNRPGFEIAKSTGLFSYFDTHAHDGMLFDTAMQSLTETFARAFAAAYDFSRMGHVVDVGGGTGLLLAAVLDRFPNLHGTVFELPPVAARVRTTDRLRAHAGSVLDDIPPQADAYILSHVLHDWDDDSCLRMLGNVRRAMPPQARVLVYEIVAPAPNNWWSQDRISDLEMLAMLPGRERTREEFAALLDDAGLRLHRIIPTGAPESILEAGVSA